MNAIYFWWDHTILVTGYFRLEHVVIFIPIVSISSIILPFFILFIEILVIIFVLIINFDSSQLHINLILWWLYLNNRLLWLHSRITTLGHLLCHSLFSNCLSSCIPLLLLTSILSWKQLLSLVSWWHYLLNNLLRLNLLLLQ